MKPPPDHEDGDDAKAQRQANPDSDASETRGKRERCPEW
jgi:hypothetical protein